MISTEPAVMVFLSFATPRELASRSFGTFALMSSAGYHLGAFTTGTSRSLPFLEPPIAFFTLLKEGRGRTPELLSVAGTRRCRQVKAIMGVACGPARARVHGSGVGAHRRALDALGGGGERTTGLWVSAARTRHFQRVASVLHGTGHATPSGPQPKI
eukprot:scaffold67399_cov60-Phaeocystis_antarctica.AAC.3